MNLFWFASQAHVSLGHYPAHCQLDQTAFIIILVEEDIPRRLPKLAVFIKGIEVHENSLGNIWILATNSGWGIGSIKQVIPLSQDVTSISVEKKEVGASSLVACREIGSRTSFRYQNPRMLKYVHVT